MTSDRIRYEIIQNPMKAFSLCLNELDLHCHKNQHHSQVNCDDSIKIGLVKVDRGVTHDV